jgi:hypothetical protein
LRPDQWQQDSLGIGYFQHQAKGNPNNIIKHYIANPGNITVLPWDEALQIIDKFGLTTAKLHLIFAAHTMRQDKPWSSQFTLKGSDLIEEMGWDKTTIPQLMRSARTLLWWLFVLDCLLIEATWVEGRHKKGGILAALNLPHVERSSSTNWSTKSRGQGRATR